MTQARFRTRRDALFVLATTGWVLGLAGAADPQLAASASRDGGLYRLDPSRTSLRFTARVLGLGAYPGQFKMPEGEVLLDPSEPGRVRIDVSAPIDQVSTPNPWITQALQGPRWLDAAQYPRMSFHAEHLSLMGEGRIRVDGRLTLRGVTRPLTLEGRLDPAAKGDLDRGLVLGLKATGELRRSAYGLLAYRPLIGDELEISLDAAFVRASGGAAGAMSP